MDTRSAPRLIAFAGQAGSGKSEAASVLMDAGFVRVKFADILKAMLAAFYEMCGLDQDEIARRMEGDLKEEPDSFLQGRTPRHAMQTLGGDWGREMLHPRLWIGAWEKRVRLQMNAGLSVVVDDVRYGNEAAAVRGMGGVIYLIHRPTNARSPGNHPSEHLDLTPDIVLGNTSPSPEEFRATVAQRLQVN